MADSESVLPARSSQQQQQQQQPRRTAEPVSSHNYAFLVHSHKTLTQNMPPRVDSKLLARQKRRRTSPEDHAILETEYQKNPKPDKTTRAGIVSRVSLGEKEVQIWFQNRRQNDRRKSKPLHLSQDSANADVDSSGCEEQLLIRDAAAGPATERGMEESFVSEEDVCASAPKDIREPGQHGNSAKRKRDRADTVDKAQTADKTDTADTADTPPSLRLSLSFDGEALVRKQDELTPSPQAAKGGSRAALRIAMSADGKAVVRAQNEPSPSKNRMSMFSTTPRVPPRLAGLRRSSSAVAMNMNMSIARLAGTDRDNKPFGRSRSARNWEAYFDTDARSALSTPTSCSQGVSGSAAAASPVAFGARGHQQRSLSRSLSARHALPASAATGGICASGQNISDKRRKLSRTVSSLGRLESTVSSPSKLQSADRQPDSRLRGSAQQLSSSKEKPTDEVADFEHAAGDSDKENWIPGTHVSRVRRRGASHATARRRPVLRETVSSDSMARRARNLNNLANSSSDRHPGALFQKPSKPVQPDADGADVAALMASFGDHGHDEDLDCIQGLLSLSQGAWR